ncbi:MAG: hypothetical protein GY762_19860 [Proteobacteria bacterium]|nr:hypothetical protein [Pseudomonadota bacterium]
MPFCNGADSGYAVTSKGADFRQVADHEKNWKKFNRSCTVRQRVLPD